jgi:hypothetical protein
MHVLYLFFFTYITHKINYKHGSHNLGFQGNNRRVLECNHYEFLIPTRTTNYRRDDITAGRENTLSVIQKQVTIYHISRKK